MNKINALTLGSDINVWKDPDGVTIRREIEYSKRCERYISLRYTKPGYNTIHIGDNMHIYPTNSKSKGTFFFDALKLGIKLIREWSPHVIVSQDTFGFGLMGFILKEIKSLPLVVHYHSGFFTNPYWLAENRYNRLLTILGFFVSKHADAIRTVSTDICNDLVKLGLKPDRIFYATPPVSSKGFLEINKDIEEKITSRFHLNPSQTFVFIGRLSKEKNIPMMFRAIKRLSFEYSDLKSVIIGKGPEEKKLHRIVKESGIGERVIFVGAVPYNEIKDYIRVGCALLVTSFYEGTAKVIKEAAFAGRATISTKTSGVNDAIREGETGLIVPIGDEDALVRSMAFFLANPEKALSMGRRARKFVSEEFKYEKDVDRIVRIWESVTRKSEARSSSPPS